MRSPSFSAGCWWVPTVRVSGDSLAASSGLATVEVSGSRAQFEWSELQDARRTRRSLKNSFEQVSEGRGPVHSPALGPKERAGCS